MKISKVEHTKSGISQKPLEHGGMLYKQMQTKLTGNQLEEHICTLNERAKRLYRVFNMPLGKKENKDVKDVQSANNFMKTILSQIEKGVSCDGIIEKIKNYQAYGSISKKRIRCIVDQYLKESLRKHTRGEDKGIPDIIYELLCEKFDKETSQGKLSHADLEILINVLREDYLKKNQIKDIVSSIEKQSTPVKIKDIDGEKRIVLSSSYNKKKEHIFDFLKEYAEADKDGQKELLKHMRFLILLYFYGPDKITDEYKEEIREWSFGSIIQDNQILFSDNASMLLQDKEYVKQQINEGKKTRDVEKIKNNKAKLRMLSDKIKDDINGQIVLHYNNACLHAEEKDIPWIRYISDYTMGVFANKNKISPDKLSVSYLCKNTWKVWISFIAKKYIDIGKGVYHFAMSEASMVEKEKKVVLGRVNPEFAEGISSFDYERIKAEDDLHRSMSRYVVSAVNNFSRAICSDEERKIEEHEDILYVGLKQVKLYKNARERLLRYFGGASNWEGSILDVIETQELAECFKDNMKIVRNINFHFAGSVKKSEGSDEILDELVSREANNVGKYYRKTFYANNVTMFYKDEDITKLMDHLYKGRKKYLAQIPSFNKVISKTYLPNFIYLFLKGKNKTKISEPKIMTVFSGTFYFLLKEIYYNNFLQDETLKELFCKGVAKAKDGKNKDKPYQDFMRHFHELEKLNLNFGEICQQIMIDYEQQNGQKKKMPSAIVSKKGGNPRVIENNSQKYKHFRTLLYIGLREAFMEYLKAGENKEWYEFLREPLKREQPNEENFVNGWDLKQFDDRRKMVLCNPVAGGWYITAHFISQRQLNHLIGDIKNYIQFVQDIDRRAKSTENRVPEKTAENVENYLEILSVLEFTKYFSSKITNRIEDYYEDENAFAEHIGKYVEYNKKNVEPAYALQAFCDSECKIGKNRKKLGIYYDGKNPILNRNVILAAMYGNEKLLSATMKPVTETEIRQYYKLMEELKLVLMRGSVCETEEEQKKLRHFQNLKNRIELVDVLTLSELVDDFMSQLIGWAYIRERDMMYLQLGVYYIKLFFTDSVPEDSFLRKLELDGDCSIEDGAVLYQIAAMYSFDFPLYTRKEGSNLCDIVRDGSIGEKFKKFEKEYCRDDGRIIENGLSLFEELSEHKEMDKFRKSLDHFKYFAKQEQSILDMYSKVYDSFFSYDIKLKKSVSYIISNILLSYFVNVKLSFALCGTETINKGDKAYKKKITHISIASSQSDYFTYKLRKIVTEKNGIEKVDTGACKTVNVAARDSIFIKEVVDILEYKNTVK